MRIDKTTRQKGASNWLKKLIYVDDVENNARPTGEGATSDAHGSEREPAAENEGGLILFSLRKITGKAQSAVAKMLDQLFLGLMDRSMGETNFFVVSMMGLACAKVISAQFFEAGGVRRTQPARVPCSDLHSRGFRSLEEAARKPACRLVHFRAPGMYRNGGDMRSSRAQFFGRVRVHHGSRARLRGRRFLFGRRMVFGR